jgi:hypothetical protein
MTEPKSQSKNLSAALAYAKNLQWLVLPCHSFSEDGNCTCRAIDCGAAGKHPRTANGMKDATTDAKKIESWWSQWPDANIGIATGTVSGFDAVDIDPRHGGDDSLQDAKSEHGELPETVEALTGGGGRHLLFKHAAGVRNTAGRLAGIDVRGDGGYIVVAPSRHQSGQLYSWEDSSRPGEIAIADWPTELLESLTVAHTHPTAAGAADNGKIPEGSRNSSLASLAGSMRKRGMSENALSAALLIENAMRCTPPLPEAEVRRIASSIARYTHEQDIRVEVTDAPSPPADIDWNAPQPLPNDLPPVDKFDVDILPKAFHAAIGDIAHRLQCPIDYPAVAMMIALATVVGRQLAIRPKRADDWEVAPNLWGGIVGRPGLLKTPALQEALRPLMPLEERSKEDYRAAMQEYEAAQVVEEAQYRVTKSEIQKIIKEGGDATKLAHSLQAAASKAPRQRRYRTNDITVEKLGELLNENPRGLLLFRDELTGFLRTLDKDGNETDRSFYLEAWNGTGSFVFDRIGRGTIEVEAACISILGGIQPGPLSAYMARAARGGTDDDGLVQRFQLIVWPDAPSKWLDIDTSPDPAARQEVFKVFQRLDAIDPTAIGAEVAESGSLPFLRFSPPAQDIFTEWRSALEARLITGDLHPMMEAHLSKYRSLIPSLALLIHMVDEESGPVSREALLRACAWGEYLESHANRLYAPAFEPAAAGARTLARHIERGDIGADFTVRDVQRKGWTDLREHEAALAAVELLEDLDWLRRRHTNTPGRKRTHFLVNPTLIREGRN